MAVQHYYITAHTHTHKHTDTQRIAEFMVRKRIRSSKLEEWKIEKSIEHRIIREDVAKTPSLARRTI